LEPLGSSLILPALHNQIRCPSRKFIPTDLATEEELKGASAGKEGRVRDTAQAAGERLMNGPKTSIESIPSADRKAAGAETFNADKELNEKAPGEHPRVSVHGARLT
jgi:hypothetical protein